MASLHLHLMVIFQVRRKKIMIMLVNRIDLSLTSLFRQNICIRQEAGFCCIQYSPCSDTNSWAFDNKINGETKIGTNCSEDYVEISGKSNFVMVHPL